MREPGGGIDRDDEGCRGLLLALLVVGNQHQQKC
jgi:hypothetical protein